jgi:Lar family restriction alleviation protein
MTETLKPCPFCSGTDIRIDRHPNAGQGSHRGEDVYSMCCYNCGATFPNRYRRELLVEHWNTRPQPSMPTRVEVAKLVTDAVIECGRIERKLETPFARIRAKTEIVDKAADSILAAINTCPIEREGKLLEALEKIADNFYDGDDCRDIARSALSEG